MAAAGERSVASSSPHGPSQHGAVDRLCGKRDRVGRAPGARPPTARRRSRRSQPIAARALRRRRRAARTGRATGCGAPAARPPRNRRTCSPSMRVIETRRRRCAGTSTGRGDRPAHSVGQLAVHRARSTARPGRSTRPGRRCWRRPSRSPCSFRCSPFPTPRKNRPGIIVATVAAACATTAGWSRIVGHVTAVPMPMRSVLVAMAPSTLQMNGLSPLPVDPRVVVVRDHGVLEAGLLRLARQRHEVLRRVLLAREHVAMGPPVALIPRVRCGPVPRRGRRRGGGPSRGPRPARPPRRPRASA